MLQVAPFYKFHGLPKLFHLSKNQKCDPNIPAQQKPTFRKDRQVLHYKRAKFSFLLQVLTRDSVTVSVDAVVYYRVSNATVSVANVENAHHSTRLLAQTTLRNILGTKNLHEILSDRESISSSMQASPAKQFSNASFVSI